MHATAFIRLLYSRVVNTDSCPCAAHEKMGLGVVEMCIELHCLLSGSAVSVPRSCHPLFRRPWTGPPCSGMAFYLFHASGFCDDLMILGLFLDLCLKFRDDSRSVSLIRPLIHLIPPLFRASSAPIPALFRFCPYSTLIPSLFRPYSSPIPLLPLFHPYS